MPFSTDFHLHLPHGLCVGVRLPEPSEAVADLALERLHPGEREYAAQLPVRRRITWAGGRIALREAFETIGYIAGAVLATDRGAPRLPAGIAASVSHKDGFAVALVAPDASWSVGVDVEHARAPRADIARYVLTDEERQQASTIPEADRWRDVLLRFSAKESLYKALDPYVRRYVGFKEVAVHPAANGTGQVQLNLKQTEGPFQAEIGWCTREDLFLTTARVRLAKEHLAPPAQQPEQKQQDNRADKGGKDGAGQTPKG